MAEKEEISDVTPASHEEITSTDEKKDYAEVVDGTERRQSVALNIVENPLKVIALVLALPAACIHTDASPSSAAPRSRWLPMLAPSPSPMA
jgi:hypothetical protein